MKHIISYFKFINEAKIQIERSTYKPFDVTIEDLLKTIRAVVEDLYSVFSLSTNDIGSEPLLEDLHKSSNFRSQLRKMKLEFSDIESSIDSETFLNKNTQIQFFTVWKRGLDKLGKPEYLLLQRKEENNTPKTIECYKVREDISKMYDKLSSKTVEIKNGKDVFIYKTGNAGNNWTLQNSDVQNDTFKQEVDREEFMKMIQNGENIIKISY